MTIKTKRVYEPFEKSDGYRILVDRLWPRGIKKEDAHVDLWLKEVAPSTELRKWIHADPSKWSQFTKRYHDELKDAPALEELVSALKEHKTVTFLYSAKDEEQNNALVLKEFVAKHYR